MYNNYGYGYGYGPLMPKDVTDEAFDTVWNAARPILTFIGMAIGFIIGYAIGWTIKKIVVAIHEAKLKKQIEEEETRLQSAPGFILKFSPEAVRDVKYVNLRKDIEREAKGYYFKKVVSEKSIDLRERYIRTWRNYIQPQSDRIIAYYLNGMTKHMFEYATQDEIYYNEHGMEPAISGEIKVITKVLGRDGSR